MQHFTTKHDTRQWEGVINNVILFLGIAIGSWFVVPGPRWALVTLGASATLLMHTIVGAVLPLPRRMTLAITMIIFLGHVGALTLALELPPTLSVGEPPGKMLSSFAIQSPSHAIQYRVPYPRQWSDRMRVKVLLAQPYDGPVDLRIDISSRLSGTMRPPLGGNLSEREFVFEMKPFESDGTVLLTITQDAYDPNLRFATWKSNLGRQIHDQPEYLTEYGEFSGLPDPLTGVMTRFWPLIWMTGI